jgi:hypothetical protein
MLRALPRKLLPPSPFCYNFGSAASINASRKNIMPVKRQRQGDNVIYTLEGPLDAELVRQFFHFNYRDYGAIGDALGAVIDLRPMTRVTVAGLRTVQGFMRGVIFDTPVAFVGPPDPIVRAFLSGLEALSSRRGNRFRFFQDDEHQEPLVTAIAWLESWYEEQGRDRAALHGRISTEVPDVPDEESQP